MASSNPAVCPPSAAARLFVCLLCSSASHRAIHATGRRRTFRPDPSARRPSAAPTSRRRRRSRTASSSSTRACRTRGFASSEASAPIRWRARSCATVWRVHLDKPTDRSRHAIASSPREADDASTTPGRRARLLARPRSSSPPPPERGATTPPPRPAVPFTPPPWRGDGRGVGCSTRCGRPYRDDAEIEFNFDGEWQSRLRCTARRSSTRGSLAGAKRAAPNDKDGLDTLAPPAQRRGCPTSGSRSSATRRAAPNRAGRRVRRLRHRPARREARGGRVASRVNRTAIAPTPCKFRIAAALRVAYFDLAKTARACCAACDAAHPQEPALRVREPWDCDMAPDGGGGGEPRSCRGRRAARRHRRRPARGRRAADVDRRLHHRRGRRHMHALRHVRHAAAGARGQRSEVNRVVRISPLNNE